MGFWELCWGMKMWIITLDIMIQERIALVSIVWGVKVISHTSLDPVWHTVLIPTETKHTLLCFHTCRIAFLCPDSYDRNLVKLEKLVQAFLVSFQLVVIQTGRSDLWLFSRHISLSITMQSGFIIAARAHYCPRPLGTLLPNMICVPSIHTTCQGIPAQALYAHVQQQHFLSSLSDESDRCQESSGLWQISVAS